MAFAHSLDTDADAPDKQNLQHGTDAAVASEQHHACTPGSVQELELGPRELEALVAAVYPECLPSEFRHFQVHCNSLHRLSRNPCSLIACG